jgi:hypothetical protein
VYKIQIHPDPSFLNNKSFISGVSWCDFLLLPKVDIGKKAEDGMR